MYRLLLQSHCTREYKGQHRQQPCSSATNSAAGPVFEPYSSARDQDTTATPPHSGLNGDVADGQLYNNISQGHATNNNEGSLLYSPVAVNGASCYDPPQPTINTTEELDTNTLLGVSHPCTNTRTNGDLAVSATIASELVPFTSGLVNGNASSHPYSDFVNHNAAGSDQGFDPCVDGGGNVTQSSPGSKRYPGAESEEVTACCIDLVLVQFLCPALVDPEPHGMCDAPVSQVARFNLMQVRYNKLLYSIISMARNGNNSSRQSVSEHLLQTRSFSGIIYVMRYVFIG